MVKLEEFHEFIVQEGIEKDPRDRSRIDDLLEDRKENFEDLEGARKEMFDVDRLENPFDDTKVIYGGDKDVERFAVGVDMEVQELVLLDRLNEKGRDVDGVITHHPTGRALAKLHEVMGLQIDVLSEYGIPVSQAEGMVRSRSSEVKKGIHPGNHPRVPKTAELLDMALMTMHTAADNHAYSYMKDYLDEEEPDTLNDLIDTILEVPEYRWSLKYGMEPQIHAGDDKNRAGKVGVLGFTGGTDLGDDIIEKMVNSGIDTLVAMHAPKGQIEKAEEKNINIVTAGHMPSDSLGINLILDKAQQKYDIEILPMSGYKRVKRNE
ncbi:hypothetical protein AKJ52_00600 [candidate division MSBL1 archaeon SCGC-AAA382C18]|uniref:NGG1p interacting factor NIF3 n=1 Tax=candidate division MSBL1 archaeon SCGC-AAA382C18 TaxID=1698281 RepID=A0A133VLH5_9EURY|nr:hypothetical protein AKJ52_00600 [candidate division MSBL1 archaeon SCGC-AAA382C18]